MKSHSAYLKPPIFHGVGIVEYTSELNALLTLLPCVSTIKTQAGYFYTCDMAIIQAR